MERRSEVGDSLNLLVNLNGRKVPKLKEVFAERC